MRLLIGFNYEGPKVGMWVGQEIPEVENALEKAMILAHQAMAEAGLTRIPGGGYCCPDGSLFEAVETNLSIEEVTLNLSKILEGSTVGIDGVGEDKPVTDADLWPDRNEERV